MHVPFSQKQDELLLGEIGVHKREGDRVEREVPRGVPRILPLVRHREDVGVVEMRPIVIAPVLALGRRRRTTGVAREPRAHVVVITLLREQHSGEGLPLHAARVVGKIGVNMQGVEFIRFADALRENALELRTERRGACGCGILIGQSKPQRNARARRNRLLRERGNFRAGIRGIDGGRFAVNEVTVERVLDVRRNARRVEDSLVVRFVFGEEQARTSFRQEPAPPVAPLVESDHSGAGNIFIPP